MEALKYVLEHPEDREAQAKLNWIIEQTKNACDHLANVAQLTPQEELVRSITVDDLFC